MKKTLLLFTVFLLSVASTGCSDDDDNPVDAGNLIGKWLLTGEYDGDDSGWDYDWSNYEITLEFHTDGTGIYGFYKKGNLYNNGTTPFTWSLDANTLTMSAGYSKNPGTIEKLDGEQLLISWVQTLKDGRQVTEKALFKRM